MKKAIMALGCLLLMISGCGDSKADSCYSSGIEAIANGQYDEAITQLEQMIETGKRLPEAYRAYGIAWMGKESYPEAIAAFSRSLNSMDDENTEFEKEVMFRLAEARLDSGQTEKALEVYSNILKKGADTTAFYLRGKLYMSQNDYENAREDFVRALEGCKDYNLYINIYQIYAEKNKEVDGVEYLEMALNMEPVTGEDYYHRGRIFEYQKEYEKAKDALMTSMNMEYADAMLLLGRIYLEMDDPASAASLYREYLSVSDKDARAYNGLAICDIYNGNYDSALENISKGLAENDEEEKHSLLYNEIVAYEYKRDFMTAKSKMAVYLDLYPDDAEGLRENEFLSTR
ncbi:MAG: tetratricopeptide repeat protein [Oliverpabstia sp.]